MKSKQDNQYHDNFRIKNAVGNLINQLRFGFFITYLNKSYLKLMISGFIPFQLFVYNGQVEGKSLAISAIIIILTILLPAIIYMGLKENKSNLDQEIFKFMLVQL
ncbi:UNKNOWN [Stylonychia lemnae]|uniref:Uncharacterized protein n=1 Tax=Stylonychia lemnae TaxID=5949 RepID=A0A077ZRT9_STYLE|nr:UNKNOWN [Stylonychia lemnae]|eukprot:CDW71206.1 UNKNOWN [Stylonychia lemnae]